MRLVVAALGTLLACAPQGARAARYWLAGPDPVTQAEKHRSGPADYMALFEPNAPWPQAAARLGVMKISTQFALRAPPDMMRRLVRGLAARHVALAMETGMLAADRGCGRGEGYSPAGTLDTALGNIRAAGGTLSFIAMDEVVWFGRENSWKLWHGLPRCQDNVAELAREVVASMALVHRYFPAAQVGAVEPVSNHLDPKRVVADYLAFADQFRALTGAPLAFWHADIAWRTEYQPTLALLHAGLRARGVRFGVIIGGGAASTTDTVWVANALEKLRGFQADPASALDDVVVQSWQELPTHMLPETDPGTFTYLLRNAEMIAH